MKINERRVTKVYQHGLNVMDRRGRPGRPIHELINIVSEKQTISSTVFLALGNRCNCMNRKYVVAIVVCDKPLSLSSDRGVITLVTGHETCFNDVMRRDNVCMLIL